MKGMLVVNRYYSDSGFDYVCNRLIEEFSSRGVRIDKVASCTLRLDGNGNLALRQSYDFALFFDKDVLLAAALEKNGVRLINGAQAIEDCDDKGRTYIRLMGKVNIPRTVFSPLRYDVNTKPDYDFLRSLGDELGYPMIVKARVGSQGRQVYLASDYEQLVAIEQQNLFVPRLYQQFLGNKEVGVDYRTYVVGGKVIAAIRRKNTTSFKANVHLGGQGEVFTPSDELIKKAEDIARELNLEYGSVDFLDESGTFLEANSNAYFTLPEKLGFNIAGAIAEYVIGGSVDKK